MNTALQDTLLQLFQQVPDDLESIPTMPVNGWQKGSPEWQLLTRFHDMLERIQQRMQQTLKAEEQLREKEAEYRSIFEAAIDALFIANLDGFIVEANPAACRMYGYTYEEFIGLHGTAITAPDSQHLVAEGLQAIKAGDKFQVPIRAAGLRKDGSTFTADGYSTPFMYKSQLHILAVVRDVTEQVHAEQELREKEVQYRGIFEASVDGLLISDLEGEHIVEANPAICQMNGYSREELLALPPANLITPEYHHLVAESIQAIKEGGLFYNQAIGLRKDGTTFHAESRGTTFMYKGKPHILTISRDITERVQVQEKLREKEAEYRSVFEASTDGLVINDLEDGHLVEVNPAMYRMHGYTYEEFIALHPMAFIHPDSHALFAEYLETVKTGNVFHARATDVRKDDTPFPVEVHGTTFTYKGKPHVLAVVRDITEQVRAEEQLREKEAQYRSIFEATTDGLVICDLEDGHVVEANPAACKIYGYSYEEFIGLPPSAIIHPEKLSAFMEKGLPAVRAGGERQTQGVNLRKDGSAFPIDLHQTAFTYQGKRHMLGVVRDITEQVQAQQLLEQRVEERTRELSSLLEVSHNVASTIELKPLLGLILDQLQEVVHYGGAAIATLQDDEFTFLDYLGPLAQEQVTQMRLLFSQSAAHQQVLHSGEPMIIADALEDSFLAQSLREASRVYLGKEAADYMHSWMGIPLRSKERVIGLLSLSHNELNYFTPRHARMAIAIANQAAVAIENARLYEQAQELAALEERQRLARELHDSVSQALYGISLGAHTARTLLDRDPGKVAEPLSYVLTQAETALTEMRALIFELRPESLETEGLVAALGRQAVAIHARHGVEVLTELGYEPDLPLKVKQELYRFAQEALHNTVKHARANRVDIRMHWSSEGFLLEIGDDGVGFDQGSAFPGHLGLHSMRERATRLGGALQIASAPGEGTRIHLRLPASVRTGHIGVTDSS